MSTLVSIKKFDIQRKIFWALLALVGVLVLGYVYFTILSIVHVAERKREENNIAWMQGNGVTLELQYIEAQRSVTLERASIFGFVEKQAKFAARATPIATVGLESSN